MTEYHPQKSLSNNARSELRISLPQVTKSFFHGDVRFIWMAIWLINLTQNESNSYTMFTCSHCYEILCYNHVTNTEKQGGTGVNLYQNEKHTMNWCHANTPSD